MTRKRWSLTVEALLLAALSAIIALVVIVDPFEIYHRALFYNPPYESETQMYSVAGIARSYDYDSIIIGSSVTENCTPSVYEETLGGRFVKLCMNAGLSLDHAKIMDIALRTHDVQRVVYGLDLFAYSYYYNNQKAETPDYLYDDLLHNDVRYWLNKSVLFSYIPKALASTGVPDEDASRDSMYFWHPPSMPGEEALRSRIDFTVPVPEQDDPARMLELAQLSMEHNLLPYIQQHRDTTFTIFFPPYSLLYWANEAEGGDFEPAMAQKQLIAEMLLAEPNVELFDFQSRFDWTTDYSLYYDRIHYISSVNDEMAFAMARGENRVTDAAQLRQSIDSLRKAVYALFPQA